MVQESVHESENQFHFVVVVVVLVLDLLFGGGGACGFLMRLFTEDILKMVECVCVNYIEVCVCVCGLHCGSVCVCILCINTMWVVLKKKG